MDMLTFFNYIIWRTYYVFSLFQPSGSCKFFRFEYYTSDSNSENGASWHHYRPVARICKSIFLSSFARKRSQKEELPGNEKPTLAKSWHWGWLHWWTLWKIELRIGVRHMKNLPTMEISWILTHSICTRPISGSLNQLPEIMEEKAVATLSW